MTSFVVVGSGIVGLATARELALRGDEVIVLEKESDLAEHQTGRNSGVIHSGLYYVPGSYKARLCAAGAQSMKRYAAEHGVRQIDTGKLVVATSEDELPRLDALARRAVENGVPARIVSPDEAREYEPHVAVVSALRVESTGIVDYVGVCRAMAEEIITAGGEIRFGTTFESARNEAGKVVVETSHGRIVVDGLVNCAGLQSDRVAQASGVRPDVRIIPFRGEYFTLKDDRSDLVKGLIYPVPDPRFPFLGVHLTKMVDGSVHAGPNAVFALAREGYRWRDISLPDLWSAGTWPGLWRLGAKFAGTALGEVRRSASKKQFAATLARLVPDVSADDLVPAKAGVRAQAMHRDGRLVDDFHLLDAPRQIHVLNAPSPAATASLEIAKTIVERLDGVMA
ncbi:L-2-hydroxyglutarate oxidase LhgO [Microbacterium hydrocarbonoxydans]|uniref:L-2-hydroxyglutarate oxidase LhgO n=1 Tax=Microbacterium hydrocarbonoxydans TaxID=273678 RepID=A0A0M2HQX0_9MICO|nr:L-2-hydroxyglutarate oxidase [Microbacterium hydrocarbonoxydans]KJL46871.1 L-2-hydroxyglutarate oxidase LhgO [Microbacterium hydrocarbonoxydans]